MKRWLVVGLIGLPLFAAHAGDKEHRELGAHEHGHGSFNIAIEGKRVSMELESPGADIVGFEHKARTDAQKAAVAAAKKTLAGLVNVVGLPAAAGCKLTEVEVELEIEDDDHDDHKKDDHKKEAKAKDEAEKSHSEFHVEYDLTCNDPGKITELTFPYFDSFKGAEELEVSIVGPKSQKKFEVDRKNAKISLGGII